MPGKSFEQELSELINKHSLEGNSNTPDFILAEYMSKCLENFNTTSVARERWYGQALSIASTRELDNLRYENSRLETLLNQHRN